MKHRGIEIKWAVLFTLVSLIWMTLEKAVGLHDKYIDYHIYLTNLFIIPAVAMIVAALKEKRRKFYAGSMSYQQGLISGLILSLFIALLSPLSQWITSYIITPEYFPNAIKRSVELGYFKNTAAASANFNYPNYAVQGAIGIFITGLFTAAIALLFFRKRQQKNP